MAQHPKRILITGATGTIGTAIAERIVRGECIACLQAHRSVEKAEQLVRTCQASKAQVFLQLTDLSTSDGIKQLIAATLEAMGGIDLFIHAAAIFERTPFGEVEEAQWDKLMGVNLKSSFFLAQEASRLMQADGGTMLFLSDVAAQKPYGSYLPYSITKAGIDALVKGLARSLAPKVRVNAIAPYIVSRPEGLSESGWNDILSKTPMRKASTPQEIAEIAETLVQAQTITGQVIAVDGGRLLR